MQSNALEKSNSDNVGTTTGLKIAATAQRGNCALVLESSAPAFAQSSATAKKTIQVLGAIRERADNKKDRMLFYTCTASKMGWSKKRGLVYPDEKKRWCRRAHREAPVMR